MMKKLVLLSIRATMSLATGLILLSLTLPLRADDPSFEQANKILTKYCAGCHNADDQEGEFALDTFAGLLKGGENGNAITPGSASSSRMIQHIKGKLDPKMPPVGEARPTDSEIQLLVDWIEGGANGPNGTIATRTELDSPKVKTKVKYQPVTALAFSSDENVFAVARFGKIEIRDAKTNSITKTINEFPGKVTSLCFMEGDQYLLAGTGVAGLYGEAVMVDLVANKIVKRFRGHRDMVYSVAVSNDEKWIATSGYDRKTVLWKPDSEQPVREFIGHNDAVFECAFDAEAELLVTASADATAKVWKVENGKRLDTRGEPLKEQYTVAISPDGNSFVAGGEDHRIRKWKLVSRKPNQTNPLLISRFAHESAIQVLRYHPAGEHLISVASDGRIKIWDAKSLTQEYVFDLQTESVQAIAVGQDCLRVGRMDGTIDQLDWPTEKLAATSRTDISDQVVAAPTTSAPNAKVSEYKETEPNDQPAAAMPVEAPFTLTGVIHAHDRTDVDLFRFAAKKGEQWVIETRASRDKSPLDSQLAILDSDGKPVPRVLLRSIRDSYFTFRGKNSMQTGDFRIHNWEEMNLNQLLYCNGEVVKLHHYPRGPDSGYNVFPNFGNRHGLFDTTPIAHALHEPCFVVEAHPPGTEFPETGLPNFLLNFENDDESTRSLGSDSQVTFTAPEDGEYLIRVRDSRDFDGEDYKYTLTASPVKPSFRISNVNGENPTLIRGGYKKLFVTITRDHFTGPVQIGINDLPKGIMVNGPITIEEDGLRAFFTLYVRPDAPVPPEDAMSSTLSAVALVNGKSLRRTRTIGKIKISEDPKLRVQLTQAEDAMPHFNQERRPVIEIKPGQTITARVIVQRLGYKQRINFGKESAALNLPFGVYVDNTGLNGVLIPPNENERTFFLTAESWVKPCERLIFLESAEAGKPSSNPVVLRVVPN